MGLPGLMLHSISITQGVLPYNEWKQTIKKCIQSKENVYWTEFAILHESVSKNVSAFEEVPFEPFVNNF